MSQADGGLEARADIGLTRVGERACSHNAIFARHEKCCARSRAGAALSIFALV